MVLQLDFRIFDICFSSFKRLTLVSSTIRDLPDLLRPTFIPAILSASKKLPKNPSFGGWCVHCTDAHRLVYHWGRGSFSSTHQIQGFTRLPHCRGGEPAIGTEAALSEQVLRLQNTKKNMRYQWLSTAINVCNMWPNSKPTYKSTYHASAIYIYFHMNPIKPIWIWVKLGYPK